MQEISQILTQHGISVSTRNSIKSYLDGRQERNTEDEIVFSLIENCFERNYPALIPSLWELLGIPYVGNDAYGEPILMGEALDVSDEVVYIENYLDAYLPLLPMSDFVDDCKINKPDTSKKIQEAYRASVDEACYAIKTYQRDLSGKVTAEHYFDTRSDPAISSLGQYREQYQRDENGRICQITYLDEDGDPAPTNAGYTILKRTYYRDGTADTDMYFNDAENPIALSKGQYGIKRRGKVNLLLDKNSHITLCVDNIPNSFPFMVVVFGCIIGVLMMLLPRKAIVLLTVTYVLFILYETLMFRETGDVRMNFVLFSYADRFFTEQSMKVCVINNIWLFVPLGTGLYQNTRKKWVLLVPFLLSVAIETTQYITGLDGTWHRGVRRRVWEYVGGDGSVYWRRMRL